MHRVKKCLRIAFTTTPIILVCSLLIHAEEPTTTSIVVHNRSSYKMFSAVWDDGENCSHKQAFNPPLDINGENRPRVTVPAGKPIAIGVAIFEMQGKSPVVCDLIHSFVLKPSHQYLLEYDVYDRRCYGQLFREESGVQKLVTSDSEEAMTERFPEFGWDQFEPGCTTP